MNWAKNEPLIKNHHTAEVLGVVFIVAGVFFLYDAHEGRGNNAPFWSKFLPGV